MINLWLKIKIWTKLGFVGLALLYLLIFVFENSGYEVKFWYWFRHEPSTNVLFLVSGAFISGVITAVLVSTTIRTVKQVREIQDRARHDRIDREVAEMREKAARLRSRPDELGSPHPEIEISPSDPAPH